MSISLYMVLVPHHAYLVYIDWKSYKDVEKVPQGQASNEDIRSISHAFVLVNDPQQCRVPNDAHHKDGTGHNGIDVLEDVSDFSRLYTHRRQCWLWLGILRKVI